MKPSTFRTNYYTDKAKKKRAFDGLQQINIKMRNRNAETTRTIKNPPLSTISNSNSDVCNGGDISHIGAVDREPGEYDGGADYRAYSGRFGVFMDIEG